MEQKNNGTAIRTLKVYDKVFVRGGHGIFCRYYVMFPEIRLVGKWLEDCGFKAGQYIEVHQEENKLTITPAWFEQNDDVLPK